MFSAVCEVIDVCFSALPTFFLCVKTSRSFEYRDILFKRCPITEGQVEAVAPEAVATAVDTTAGVVAGMVVGMVVDMAGVATAMGARNTTS